MPPQQAAPVMLFSVVCENHQVYTTVLANSNFFPRTRWFQQVMLYHIAGKFGKSWAIRQTKIIQTLHYVVITINSQRHSPNFPSPNLLRNEFAKFSSCQIFLLYGMQ